MGAALFYHLTRSGPGQLLPMLIGKSLQAGWPVELRGRDPARQQALDEALWLAEGFLPHGVAGGDDDARQPVLLTLQGQPAANAPRCLIAVDGAQVEAAEVAALDRVCIVFDGNDPQALEQARAQWRDLRAQGAAAEYWSEADGRWQRKQ
ncbi:MULTISPECIES: DNA polymerase III subunit chi [unclassified Paracoccus (in: a-proteobacteria)]|uniref:DNA polymerase III subunit chi n=1 Tax=unclassified Paracoccus (in: a-proteobacteria) TaxID=2688777 RepID=UPI0012B19499|nr:MULTISPECIES: DNA polymerase III subunit chi [unclassified Paracoccus (in: a-proteobacteria)]UXU73753.1 DNA polymerase III subunit chi [Paracoccus sp. SMMA_5]UXU79643.1 DNA polymerase III subunit chi [Paracoccus sp. SMMA_5_TC]